MTEAEWGACSDPNLMLEFLRSSTTGSKRKLRLFAVACCRRIWHLLTDKRSRQAVETAERFADGLASTRELTCASDLAQDANDRHLVESNAAHIFASCAGQSVVNADDAGASGALAEEASAWDTAAYAADAVNAADSGSWGIEREMQSGLLRDIFGNPFRAATLDSSWLSWRESTIPRLAQAIYEERQLPLGTLDVTKLLILADALAEASADGDILDHLHRPEPHVRGCHVIDMLLGKR